MLCGKAGKRNNFLEGDYPCPCSHIIAWLGHSQMMNTPLVIQHSHELLPFPIGKWSVTKWTIFHFAKCFRNDQRVNQHQHVNMSTSGLSLRHLGARILNMTQGPFPLFVEPAAVGQPRVDSRSKGETWAWSVVYSPRSGGKSLWQEKKHVKTWKSIEIWF